MSHQHFQDLADGLSVCDAMLIEFLNYQFQTGSGFQYSFLSNSSNLQEFVKGLIRQKTKAKKKAKKKG